MDELATCLTTYIERLLLLADEGGEVTTEGHLALFVDRIHLARLAQLVQIVERVYPLAARFHVQTRQVAALDGVVQVLVGALGPVDFTCAGALRHDETVGVAAVLLAVVHDAEAVANLVSNHEGRLKVGGLVDGATVVTFAHSAHPGEAQNSAVVPAGRILVQIKSEL